MTETLAGRIKAVLDAHQFNPAGPGLNASCYADGCGWTHPWDRPTHEMWDAHRAHVAGQVTGVLAGTECPRCFIEAKPCARHCDPTVCPDPAHTGGRDG